MTGGPWTLLRRIQVPKALPKTSVAKKAEAANVRKSARPPVTKKAPEDPYLPSGTLFEARLHANVDMAKRTRVRTTDDRLAAGRPRAREIPLGEKRVNRKDKGRALVEEETPKPVEEPVQRARPSFRSPIRLQPTEPETPVASTSAHIYKKPSFRRSYSSQAAAQNDAAKVPTAAWQVQRDMPHKYRRKKKHALKPKMTLDGAGLPILTSPINTPDLVKILRDTCYFVPPTPELLKHLILYHNSWLQYANTSTYSILLQLSLRVADIRNQNYLLRKMEHDGIPFDATTWDVYMEGLALEGRWKRLAGAYEDRQRAGTPIMRVGWTRILQAATRNGKTSISKADDTNRMSPIYSAVYTLPKGVRQLPLEYFSQPIGPDVDHLLAAMMPADAIPMDFQTTLAVAHRLAKQRRWQEASDIADIWLDRSEHSPKPASVKDPIGEQCTSLLHVIMEGLVITRAEPGDILAFVDGYLEKYASFRPKPSLHTLFLLLQSYRSMSVARCFIEAAQTYEEFIRTYSLDTKSPSDLYSDTKCRRQLQNYGLWALRIIHRPGRHVPLQQEIRKGMSALRIDLAAIDDMINNGAPASGQSGKEARKPLPPDLEAKLRQERSSYLAFLARLKLTDAMFRHRGAAHRGKLRRKAGLPVRRISRISSILRRRPSFRKRAKRRQSAT